MFRRRTGVTPGFIRAFEEGERGTTTSSSSVRGPVTYWLNSTRLVAVLERVDLDNNVSDGSNDTVVKPARPWLGFLFVCAQSTLDTGKGSSLRIVGIHSVGGNILNALYSQSIGLGSVLDRSDSSDDYG